MPIYEYVCPACRHEFDELIRNDRDERTLVCPKCGAKKVQRKLSTFAAHAATGTSASRSGPCATCGDPGGACPWTP